MSTQDDDDDDEEDEDDDEERSVTPKPAASEKPEMVIPSRERLEQYTPLQLLLDYFLRLLCRYCAGCAREISIIYAI